MRHPPQAGITGVVSVVYAQRLEALFQRGVPLLTGLLVRLNHRFDLVTNFVEFLFRQILCEVCPERQRLQIRSHLAFFLNLASRGVDHHAVI